jgi:hypothetical protein
MASAVPCHSDVRRRILYLPPHPMLEPFPLAWNRLLSLLCRIFDGEPDPLRRKML